MAAHMNSLEKLQVSIQTYSDVSCKSTRMCPQNGHHHYTLAFPKYGSYDKTQRRARKLLQDIPALLFGQGEVSVHSYCNLNPLLKREH